MKNTFTQGTIISNVRSRKYTEIKCKGIVISARCDLAQNKIQTFHYVTALPLEDWIFEELYYRLVKECIDSERNSIKSILLKNGLDFETLLELGFEKSKIVIEKALPSQKAQSVINQLEMYYKKMNRYECDDIDEKKKFFRDNTVKKRVKDYIKKLFNGSYPKFSFVPQKSYMNKGALNDGLVIDLHDIYQLGIEYATQIQKNEIDYILISNEQRRNTINQSFYFQDESDFVICEGIIESPWIEYIMQHFAISFMRIGVDNATQNEIDDFYFNFLERI